MKKLINIFFKWFNYFIKFKIIGVWSLVICIICKIYIDIIKEQITERRVDFNPLDTLFSNVHLYLNLIVNRRKLSNRQLTTHNIKSKFPGTVKTFIDGTIILTNFIAQYFYFTFMLRRNMLLTNVLLSATRRRRDIKIPLRLSVPVQKSLI